MKCSSCGGTHLTTPRRIELTKEVGTVAVTARDGRGREVLQEIKAVVCLQCGTTQFVVAVQGLDWSY